MIDHLVIHVGSGSGGDGMITGRHSRNTPQGGPDGGSGGDGGEVSIVAHRGMNTLRRYGDGPRFIAGDGATGGPSKRKGRMGKSVCVQVPIGTEVWDGAERLADLNSEGETVIVVGGGQGGRGNAAFVTSTNQFPLLSEKGEAGVSRTLRLELKLLADVGLVGAPNAGKSSLLAAISRARPKVAAYPFTTLEPVLGVVEHKGESFVAADVPGLVEGAHQGVGLGDEFLRHTERTRLLIHVVDGSTDDPMGVRSRVDQELRLFNESLGRRPQVIALNKIDMAAVSDRVPVLTGALASDGTAVVPVSAASGKNINALLDKVLEGLDRLKREEADEPAPRYADTLRPLPVEEKPKVRRKDGGFVVEDSSISRIAAMVDPDNWDAKLQFHAHLKRKGVVRALEEAGVSHGDTVRIGDMEWEWE